MPATAPTLAVDFGTSNSAAAVLEGGQIRRIAIEKDAQTLPTAVFFPDDGGKMRIGTAAAQALIAGEDGRYMRALKSILGDTLFHETRLVAGKRRTLSEVVTAFLAQVKQQAEAQIGHPVTRVLSGRPVRFHSSDDARNARAEEDLRACYHAAGFERVEFLFEPEAAALASQSLGQPGQIGLIVDIGGGTSDFSVFQVSEGRVQILASHGVRLGGTDFDQAVSLTHVMPLLGRGGALRRSFGEGLLPMPNGLFVDLSTWAKIPFLYTRETERAIEDLIRHAVDPEPLQRLHDVVHHQLGHELAFAVEAGKIAANGGAHRAIIDMGCLERGLSVPITSASLATALDSFSEVLRHALYQTLFQAKVTPDQIGSVILVGGSSLMALVEVEARAVCSMARVRQSEAFTAVVDGLALATGLKPE